MTSSNALCTAAGAIRCARNLVVITGAGVSAESGLDTYRGAGGIWERYDVNEVATATALRRDPEKVWSFLLRLREHVRAARPNPAHRAIRELEDHVATVRVITQNVDGLHQAAGSTRVLEIHGNVREARDERSGKVVPLDALDLARLPPRCPETGRVLRPNVLYFGEEYDPAILVRASRWVRKADVIVVVGTSGLVPTPYLLAREGQAAGARVIDVNLDRTAAMAGGGFGSPSVDVFLEGRAGHVLPELVARL